jgi:L-ascorbate metabolism protein UlaG (beta-lactamase superfamily)
MNSGSHDGARLYYLGHAAFKWVTPSGTRIVIDPYRNPTQGRWFDRPFPEVEADLVLVTHAHFDHDAIDQVKGTPEVFDQAGVRCGADYVVRGITGHHARPEAYGEDNRVFVIRVNQVLFCHWGDNDPQVLDDLSHRWGPIDVLMLPVDESEHILTLPQIAEVTGRLSPKAIIPTHYFIPGLTSPRSTLEPIDGWLAGQSSVIKISASGVAISPEALPRGQQEVWVFEPYGFCKLTSS